MHEGFPSRNKYPTYQDMYVQQWPNKMAGKVHPLVEKLKLLEPAERQENPLLFNYGPHGNPAGGGGGGGGPPWGGPPPGPPGGFPALPAPGPVDVQACQDALDAIVTWMNDVGWPNFERAGATPLEVGHANNRFGDLCAEVQAGIYRIRHNPAELRRMYELLVHRLPDELRKDFIHEFGIDIETGERVHTPRPDVEEINTQEGTPLGRSHQTTPIMGTPLHTPRRGTASPVIFPTTSPRGSTGRPRMTAPHRGLQGEEESPRGRSIEPRGKRSMSQPGTWERKDEVATLRRQLLAAMHMYEDRQPDFRVREHARKEYNDIADRLRSAATDEDFRIAVHDARRAIKKFEPVFYEAEGPIHAAGQFGKRQKKSSEALDLLRHPKGESREDIELAAEEFAITENHPMISKLGEKFHMTPAEMTLYILEHKKEFPKNVVHDAEHANKTFEAIKLKVGPGGVKLTESEMGRQKRLLNQRHRATSVEFRGRKRSHSSAGHSSRTSSLASSLLRHANAASRKSKSPASSGKSSSNKKWIQAAVNPAQKGKFTLKAEKHNMDAQQFAEHVLANKDKFDTHTVKQAQFVQNMKFIRERRKAEGLKNKPRFSKKKALQQMPFAPEWMPAHEVRGEKRGRSYSKRKAAEELPFAGEKRKSVLDLYKKHRSVSQVRSRSGGSSRRSSSKASSASSATRPSLSVILKKQLKGGKRVRNLKEVKFAGAVSKKKKISKKRATKK